MRAIITAITAIIGIACTPALGFVSVLPRYVSEDGRETIDVTTTALVITAAISWTATLGGIWWLALSIGVN